MIYIDVNLLKPDKALLWLCEESESLAWIRNHICIHKTQQITNTLDLKNPQKVQEKLTKNRTLQSKTDKQWL